jgi:hypothetical protein
MRSSVTMTAVTLLVAVASPALAASQRDLDECTQTGDLDRAGCTRIIQGEARSLYGYGFVLEISFLPCARS